MKNLIKFTIVLIIGILFVACDDPTSREENNETTDLIDYCNQTTAQIYFIGYYKKSFLNNGEMNSPKETFKFFYVDSNHTSSTFDTLTGLDISFKYGFRYKIKDKQDLCFADESGLFI